ncbi:LysR family transcriptional regulator [Pseudogulbenkiania subflava]|uniref:DNA-binding transcriptional regulator, LysR family n=1 Tax=Pseudogulbenkiania subflava DSM 22618 TaxID=1123014 RepID=A0A1Y6BUJ0_9NEIS|nr:LysR family transcriptional regulator [Pseudogulbenkiania subflava]SMF29190.1 DNA-binding transcriptional regulator, LysR family [Pseudogulbenkiania subflava DSM 22618]
MRLRHVEVFQAIMQTGSLSAAAELLCISQPAVSKTLMHAEQQLGFALFERVKGKLYPTPEAQLLQREIATLFDSLQAVKRLASSLRHQRDRPLRLQATPAVAQAVLPAALGRWRRAFPAHPCSLATHHTTQMVQSLCLHEADLGFTLRRPDHPGVVVTPLAHGQLTVIAPLGWWPEAKLPRDLPIEELDGASCIGLMDDDPLWGGLAAMLEDRAIVPQVLTTVQTYQLAYDLVALGQGIALVDPFTARGPSPARVQLRALDPPLPVRLYAVHAVDAPLSLPARQLITLIRSLAHEMGLDGVV